MMPATKDQPRVRPRQPRFMGWSWHALAFPAGLLGTRGRVAMGTACQWSLCSCPLGGLYWSGGCGSLPLRCDAGDGLGGRLRQQLAVLKAATRVYDPCTPRLLPAGTDAPNDADGYVRVENAFPPGGAVRVEGCCLGTWPPRLSVPAVGRTTARGVAAKYRLDDITAPAADEFGKIVLLRTGPAANFGVRTTSPATSISMP
ncbi:MAG: hypothetical protein U0746_16485 [Gemmataceae bacterium]